MNIFVLDSNPKIAAQMHLDKHVVKMIIEYAQLLSTAQRLLDGVQSDHVKPDGKKKTFWLLPGESVVLKKFPLKQPYTLIHMDDPSKDFETIDTIDKLVIENPRCYNLSHQNHPCAVWARESAANYNWLFDLFEASSHEYTHRYGKVHKTWTSLRVFLRRPPANISRSQTLSAFPQAMPDDCKDTDAVQAYRNYYLGPKASIARWTNRDVPDFFKDNTKDYDVSHFSRTRSVD